MKILVYGEQDCYMRYRPAFARQMDVKLVFYPLDQSPVEAVKAHPDAQIIFSDPIIDIDERILSYMPNLRLIQSEGVSFHRFDLDAAYKRGIYVCNSKGCNATSVAEHTIMLMLMALRFGIVGHTAVREGRQMQMKQQVMAGNAPELSDCAVGLVGMGSIGQETAKRLSAFGCKLFYYTKHRRSPQIEQALHLTYLPLTELAKTCDILSLHCAVNSQTRNLVDQKFLQQCKPGAILINTARGDLMDNQAVRQALISGKLGGIAVDTLAPEPTPANHPLVDLPADVQNRAIYSPHLAGNTGSSFFRAHETMWSNARLILQGARPNFIVNGL